MQVLIELPESELLLGPEGLAGPEILENFQGLRPGMRVSGEQPGQRVPVLRGAAATIRILLQQIARGLKLLEVAEIGPANRQETTRPHLIRPCGFERGLQHP